MMDQLNFPPRDSWQALCARPQSDQDAIDDAVNRVITSVRKQGDKALLEFTKRYDGVSINALKLEASVIDAAASALDSAVINAIEMAANNIRHFHESQCENVKYISTQPGVTCWRKSIPIERVGLYIPGGTAPLISTLLMLGLPAKIAGCKQIVVCTPPGKDGQIHPAIRFVARKIGVEEIYTVGGAQAIAAMAYGTESIQKVDKIFGPGNKYVTSAKQLVQQAGVAIDMPAGPSEVLIVADAQSQPEFVAADLLSQAEHGGDSMVMLLVVDEAGDASVFVDEVQKALKAQLDVLGRKEIAINALSNSKIVRLTNIQEAMDFSNLYAPEHLILANTHADAAAEMVINAGSVFIGPYACESAGDYASGTNHTLPTNGFARSYSGVSIDSFVKKITFQTITPSGLAIIGPAIETLARAEGLQAHANAVSIRLRNHFQRTHETQQNYSDACVE